MRSDAGIKVMVPPFFRAPLSHIGQFPTRPASTMTSFVGRPCGINRRPKLALTQTWCSFLSLRSDKSGFEKIKFRAPIHLTLDQLQLGDLAFGLPV